MALDELNEFTNQLRQKKEATLWRPLQSSSVVRLVIELIKVFECNAVKRSKLTVFA